jgi:hypothetical protein
LIALLGRETIAAQMRSEELTHGGIQGALATRSASAPVMLRSRGTPALAKCLIRSRTNFVEGSGAGSTAAAMLAAASRVHPAVSGFCTHRLRASARCRFVIRGCLFICAPAAARPRRRACR